LATTLAGLALALPSAALAAGEPGTTSKPGTAVLGLAPEGAGSVIAVGSAGKAMLVQRIGADGNAGPAFGAGNGVARGVAVQADGKIVVVGNDGLTGVIKRFNADGSGDAGFGAAGTVSVSDLTVNAVAVSGAGQIVVGGSLPDAGDGFARVALVRFGPTGALDGAFGNGGVARLDLGRNSQAKSIALQADGKVVFAGQQIPDLQVVNALIGRANANGTLDTSFASAGAFYYFHPGGGASSVFNAVTIDSAGRIIGAGVDLRDTGSFALFARLTSGGALDGSFGGGGLLTPPATLNANVSEPIGPASVALAAGGEIVSYGGFQESGLKSAALWALTPAGQLDGAVPGGGRVVTQPGSALAQGRAIAVTPDGTVFGGGEASDDVFLPNNGFVTRHTGFGPLAGPPPPPPPPPPAPAVTAASLSPATLRPKTKAKLKFTLNVATTVKLTVEQKLKGRKKGSKCSKPSSKNKKGKSCTYYTKVGGSKKVSGKAGSNKLTFTRKFGSKTLKAGSYRLNLKLSSGSVKRISFSVRSR
jgi:uncharacterized delta-60 repeat protein